MGDMDQAVTPRARTRRPLFSAAWRAEARTVSRGARVPPCPLSEPGKAAARRLGARALVCGPFLLLGLAPARASGDALEQLPRRDVHALFAAAESSGRVGVARKTKPVDARPARSGEVVVSRIAGEGRETRSKPAAEGDWVVRNRCPATGDEEYLVKARTFAARYEGPLSEADGGGWREFRPRGPRMRFFVLGEREGAFRFTAPWGEQMRARPGDAVVRDPAKAEDTYRVAAAAFACTYEVVAPPRRG